MIRSFLQVLFFSGLFIIISEVILRSRKETGVFFYEQTWEALLDTLLTFDACTWDRDAICAHAQKFGVDVFKQKIKKYVGDRYDEFQRGLKQCRLDIR